MAAIDLLICFVTLTSGIGTAWLLIQACKLTGNAIIAVQRWLEADAQEWHQRKYGRPLR